MYFWLHRIFVAVPCVAFAVAANRSRGFSLVAVLRLLLLQSMVSGAHAQEFWYTGLVAPHHMRSSQTRNQTHAPWIGRQILSHWTMREVQYYFFSIIKTLQDVQVPNSSQSFRRLGRAA